MNLLGAGQILTSFVEMHGYYFRSKSHKCSDCNNEHICTDYSVKYCKWCKMPWGPPFDQHDPECKLGQAMDVIVAESE